jgi:hypothetical protein
MMLYSRHSCAWKLQKYSGRKSSIDALNSKISVVVGVTYTNFQTIMTKDSSQK